MLGKTFTITAVAAALLSAAVVALDCAESITVKYTFAWDRSRTTRTSWIVTPDSLGSPASSRSSHAAIVPLMPLPITATRLFLSINNPALSGFYCI